MSPDNGLNRTPPACTSVAVTVVPAGVTEPAFAIDISGFCPPLLIHWIVYEYPVQSLERCTFKKPKSGDDCNWFVKSDAEIPTGIAAYVWLLNTRSNVPLAATDADVTVVTVALYNQSIRILFIYSKDIYCWWPWNNLRWICAVTVSKFNCEKWTTCCIR
jgi:hypothetical protein